MDSYVVGKSSVCNLFGVGFVFVLNMYIPGVLFRSLPVVSFPGVFQWFLGLGTMVFVFIGLYIRRIPRELCFRGIWF